MNDLTSCVHDDVSRQRSRPRKALLAGISAAALLALAACSSGSSGSSSATNSTSPSSAAAAGSSSSVLSQSKALLSEAAATAVTGPSFGTVPKNQIVPWTAAMMPTPSKLATGKQISVDVVYSIPEGYTPYAAHVIQAVGAKIGWKVKVIEATAPTQPADLTAMQQAVLDKPTAIIALVIPASYVAPALAKAKSEGIYTVDVHQDTTDGGGYDAYVPDGEGVQKALLAAYAIAQSNGSAKTLIMSAPGFSDVNVPAAQSYLGACSGCNTQLVQFNPTDFTSPTAVQSDVTSKLAASSGVTYIIWPDGGLPIQTVITAISSSITNKSTKLLVNDAAPGSVQLLKTGQIPIVVYAPAAMTALVAMDDVNRMAQGQQPLAQTAQRYPVSYWTTQNSPAPTYPAITAAQLQQADWLSPFEQAWGVQLKSIVLGVSG
jgi:ABC-type sugar transport system substrate-binding protein